MNEDPTQTATQQAAGRAAAALASLGEEEQKPEGVFTALFLEVELSGPWGSDVSRRTLMDVRGEAERVTGTQFSPDDSMPARPICPAIEYDPINDSGGTGLLPGCHERLALVMSLRNRSTTLGVLDAMAQDDVKTAAERYGSLQTLPMPLFLWSGLRHAASFNHDRVFIDRPQVLAMHSAAIVDEIEDPNGYRRAGIQFDVISHHVGVIPAESGDVVADAAEVRLFKAWLIRPVKPW